MASTRRRAGPPHCPPESDPQRAPAPEAWRAVQAQPAALAALRDGGRPLLALLAAACAFKLLTVFAALDGNPLARYPTSDARYYLDRAQGLAGAVHDPLADEPFHLPPLYPWLLACLPGTPQGDATSALVLQALGGTALLALTFALARRRVSRPAAFGAVLLTLLYGPLGFYETRILGDSLAALVLIGLIVAADALADACWRCQPATSAAPQAVPSAARTGPPAAAPASAAVLWRAALLGVLVMLAALLRPQALLLFPVLLAWLARICRRAVWPMLAASVLVLLPAVLHNLRASGDLIFVSDNGGVNFWLANTGPLSGTFATDDEAFGDITRQAAVARSIAERESGLSLSPGAVSAWFVGAGLHAIAADPLRFGHRLLLRARALLESFETDIASFPETEGRLIAPLRALALPFGVLAGLCAGALVLIRRQRDAPGRQGCGAPRVPLLAVAGMVVLTALLFFHYSRFRLPLVPLLATGAAAGWDRLREGSVRPAHKALAIAVALVVAAQSFLPAPHHAPTLANGLASVGNARLALARPGDTTAAQAADRDARAALDVQPGFARAELLAARTSLLLGRYADCLTLLDSLERRLPGYPPARLHRGFLFAVRDPRNPHQDPAAARAVLDELSRTAADNPAIAAGLEQLRDMLTP